LSRDDLAPFNLHPAGCRRLAIEISVGPWLIFNACRPQQRVILIIILIYDTV